MKFFYLSVFVLFMMSVSYLISQETVNNPMLISQFMEKSPIMYRFTEFKDTILPPDRTKNLVENKFRRIKDGDEFFTVEYDESIYSDELYKSAQKLFDEKNFSSAGENFKKLFEKYPDFPKALTLQAGCLIAEGKSDDAIDILRDAITDNFIDYEAHVLLSKLYDEMGLLDVALRHILFAHIINRNDVKIHSLKTELFKKKGLNTSAWVFVPQIKYKASKSDVEMIIKEQYQGYAMVEALWKFDTDYRKTKLEPDAPINLNRLQESFIAQSVSLRIPWYMETDEGKTLKSALDNKMVNEFIYYEIILPEYPYESHKLSEERLNKLANYILTARGEIK